MSKRWDRKSSSQKARSSIETREETIEPTDTAGQDYDDAGHSNPEPQTNPETEEVEIINKKQETAIVGIVTGKLVNVRAAPDQNAAVITLVEQGAKVYILSEEEKWYKIRLTATRYAGYIVKDYVKKV